ncbi:MAG: hypothetical protein M5U16_00010 [Hyphomicrobium sp.]|nr:hypothetical protein [Hyphomicrobium sp.]
MKAHPPTVDIRGTIYICVPAKRKNDPGPLMDMEALRALPGDRTPDRRSPIAKSGGSPRSVTAATSTA